jgi:hypothetical protein
MQIRVVFSSVIYLNFVFISKEDRCGWNFANVQFNKTLPHSAACVEKKNSLFLAVFVIHFFLFEFKLKDTFFLYIESKLNKKKREKKEKSYCILINKRAVYIKKYKLNHDYI